MPRIQTAVRFGFSKRLADVVPVVTDRAVDVTVAYVKCDIGKGRMAPLTGMAAFEGRVAYGDDSHVTVTAWSGATVPVCMPVCPAGRVQ